MGLDLIFNGKTFSLENGVCNSVGKELKDLLDGSNLFEENELSQRGTFNGNTAFEIKYGSSDPIMNITKGYNLITISSNGNIAVMSNEESEDNRLMKLSKYSRLDYANYVLELGKKYPEEVFLVIIHSNDGVYLDYFGGVDNVFAYGIVE